MGVGHVSPGAFRVEGARGHLQRRQRGGASRKGAVAISHGGIALGAYGEKLAARWYAQAGYQVVARNWRCEIGEIDLLVRRGRLLVVAEVKTRTSHRFGLPAEAVTYAKQKKLRGLARVWLATAEEYFEEVRFDVVSITGRDVEVIQAAF